MYAVVRTDKMYATDNRTGLVSVRYQPGGVKLSIENGSVVKLSGLENNGTKEVYVGETPTASDSLSDIVLIATPEVMYDETKIHLSDFCNEAGSVCRGYRLHSKDVFSATKEAFVGEKPEVGKFVELTSDVKLNVVADKTGSTLVGEIVDINKVGSYTYYAVEVCTVGAQAEGDLASMQEELDKTKAMVDGMIDRSITSIESDITSIGENAFNNCTSLTSVDFPNVTSIGENAFNECYGLKTVRFPNVTKIASSGFSDCRTLTTVDLPNVTSIGATSFLYCECLTTLVIRSETLCTLSDVDALNGTSIKHATGYIYVPSALVGTYKTATNWSTYASKFRALEDYTVDGTITGELDETKI